jgi:hypothetical protein
VVAYASVWAIYTVMHILLSAWLRYDCLIPLGDRIHELSSSYPCREFFLPPSGRFQVSS